MQEPQPEAMDTTTTPAPESDSQQVQTPPVAEAQTEKDWEAEAAKWKALSRKHEDANSKNLKELEQLRAAQMSDSEKAIADAEKRGRESALVELRKEIAESKLRAAATGKVADVDALIEFVDANKFVTADGINEEAIAETVERFSKVAPAQTQQPKFGNVELGPQGDRPRQLGEADVARMTPEQIVEARSKGQLDDLLGVTS